MRGNAKLKVVEEVATKELPFGLFDKIREIQAKQQFMSIAIPDIWGGDSIHTSTTIFGCHVIMQEITEDLAEVLKTFDPNFENGKEEA